MIDETIFKSNQLGKDGFIWWLGQVADYKNWKEDASYSKFSNKDSSSKTWTERCKVRIIGYHSFRKNELEDKDLPWAQILLDPAFGSSQGGEGCSTNLTGGEICFGFFLDGDDAQQPVIVGLLNRNRNVQNLVQDDIAFKPFTGHPGNIISNTKREAIQSTTPKAPTPPITSRLEQNVAEALGAGVSIGYTGGNFVFTTAGVGNTEVFSTNFPNLGVGFNTSSFQYASVFTPGDKLYNYTESLAKLAVDQLTSKTYVMPSNCQDNMIGQITQILQDFIAFTNGIQKYADTYVNPILNEFVDIGNTIKSVARSIGGIIRLIINSIRSSLIKCVVSLFKKFIGTTVPCTLQTIFGQSVKNILNLLFCAFEKFIPTILNYIENLLGKMVDTVFNAPICAIEQWTAGILTKVMDTVEKGIDSILSGVGWLTGGLSNVFNVMNQASSLASQIYSFIGCDGLKCTTPSKWSSNFGPSQVESDNWNKMVSSINIIKGTADNLNSVESAIAGLSLYGQSPSYQNCNNSVNNPTTQDELSPLLPGIILNRCIPPNVVVFGDGVGANLVPIVGINSSIVAIQIVSGGIGFTQNPIITIQDKSNYGKGATAEAIIDSKGSISKILILDSGSGYCRGEYQDDMSLILSSTESSVYEGESFEIRAVSTTIADGTEVLYEIVGINGTDIKQNLQGSLVFKSGFSTLKIDTNIDDSILYKTLTFKIPSYNKELSVLIKDNTITDDFLLSSDSYSINEGSQFTITLNTKNLQNNTSVSFKVSGTTNGLIENQNEYSSFNVIDNSATITYRTKKGLIRANEVFKLELLNGKASVGVLINPINQGIGVDPKVCIDEIIVRRPGIGYTSGDTITDGINTYYPIISPFNGTIVGVTPLQTSICGFDEVPNLTINTNTGIGAEVLPVISLETNTRTNTNIGFGKTNTTTTGVNVINVVDCI
jgi:hypothetical protein